VTTFRRHIPRTQHSLASTAGALSLAAATCLAVPAGAQLTVRVSVPAGTPPGAAVYLAGSFNGWNPADSLYRLTRAADGAYVITLDPAIRGAVEFKFTLGSWDSVELDSAGAGVPNRRFVVPETGAAAYEARVGRWQDPANVPRRPSTARATVTVLDTAFPMPQLGRTRRVWIYLPPDYATSDKTYPVLYMHDGQNVFDDSTSYAGEWGVDEALDSLHAAGDWGAIVVAVDNGERRRLHEYSPWRSPLIRQGGEGDAYVDFLAQTLKPWIDRRFRTRPGREDTGVLGSSMGGLISLYAALKHPDVFGRAGVFSPSLWFSDSVFVAARNAAPAARPRMYFVSGAREGPPEKPRVVVADQQRMVETLAAAGWRVGTEVHAAAPEDGQHSEWFWRREFPAAYRWLFSPTQPEAPR
jgi:predicted alpha/beta superfamily hydrolase